MIASTQSLTDKYLESRNAASLDALVEMLARNLEGTAREAKEMFNKFTSQVGNFSTAEITEIHKLYTQKGLLEPNLTTGQEAVDFLKEASDTLLGRQEYLNAASFLETAVNISSRVPNFPDEQKFQLLVNLVTALQEVSDPSISQKVASPIQTLHELAANIKDGNLQVQYNYCCGKYYASQDKHDLAGTRYYKVCNIESTCLEKENLSDILSSAVESAILASPSKTKEFLIRALAQDDRAKALKDYPLLAKIHKKIAINNQECEEFVNNFKSQKVVSRESMMKNIKRNFCQHNILVMAKHYREIRLEALARRVDVSPEELEIILHEMVKSSSVNLQIDHLTGFVIFKDTNKKLESSRAGLETFCNLLDAFKISKA